MDANIKTKRWTRSPRGEFFGVTTGLAEWRGFPVGTTKLIVLILIIFSGIFPGVAVYLILAIILPLQTDDDIEHSTWYKKSSKSRKTTDYEDATFSYADKSTEDLKKEYENLKKKVEEMEDEMFNREKDWDSRFNSGADK